VKHGFGGGYTVVKDYVRQARLRHKEVFVPLAHPPGDAQVDFGKALAVIGGMEQKAHFQCMDLPHSDDCFVAAFPAENSEAFCEGPNQAAAYFDGVPRTILYDNTRIAVKRSRARENGSPRRRSVDCSHIICSRPSMGALERTTTRGTWKGWWAMRGATSWCRCRADSWEEWNAHLLEECRRRRERKRWGHTETIAERLERDRERLLPLPPTRFEACEL
jgi:transposase